MQMRRLDPLANAGPYRRISRTPVKSFALSEAQFDRVRERRPELVLIENDAAVVGRPFRDFLEIHYGFPDVESFRDRFAEMMERVVAASSPDEAPRGLLLSFRDRPNRMVADTVFWPLALDQGEQWVEMNLVAVPEQPEPENGLGDGLTVSEAGKDDNDTIADLDASVLGLPRLTTAGVATVFENAKTVRVLRRGSQPVGYVALAGEPGGWGIIESMTLTPDAEGARESVLRWCIAWLRNNGGRRVRTRAGIDDSKLLKVLRDAGFTPGETGVDYARTVDYKETRAKIDERQAHGTVIKFGDWR